MPPLDIITLIVDVVHLRQAGVPRRAVEDRLVQERSLARHAARRLIGQVDHELQEVRHRMALPLALSAESLRWDCVEVTPRQPAHN